MVAPGTLENGNGYGDVLAVKDEPPPYSDKDFSRIPTAGPAIPPELDRQITRKFDTHILPWLFGLWLLAFIDRSNIGNARIDGLVLDLDLYGNRYNIALAVFYILYILIDVPSNWVMKRVGAGTYLPVIMICWGLVGTFMGLTKSFAGLIVCRMLLGLCEGGLFGGLILYLSMFYPRHKLAFRLGLFYCAAPLSGAFGGLLATGLAEIQVDGYNRWPWIFIVEGAITVLYGLVAVWFLPHTPAKSKFLNEEQRMAAIQRLTDDAHGSNQETAVDDEKFKWKWARMALFNVNTVVLSFNFFCILIPLYSFSLFLPTIISGLGYTRVTAQLFTVPPNFCGFLTVIIGTWASDRLKFRGPIIMAGCTLAIIGYIMLLASSEPAVQYGGTFFVAAGVFPCSPTVTAWLSNNLAPHYVRATGIGIQVAIGNCAAFVATFSYLTSDSPRFIKGHSINLAFMVAVLVVSASHMLYLKRENRQRDLGKRDDRIVQVGDESELGYRHPSFRYTI